MKDWKRIFAVALLAAGCCACTRNVEPVDLSDSGIKARIETTLHGQSGLDIRYVTVDVVSRVVTVSGIARTYEDRDRIARIARRARGVDQVIVNLLVPE